jgi:hypothetical protein
LKDDRLRHYYEDQSGYGSQAYPSYFSTIEDGAFKHLIKQRTDALSLKKFYKVGTISTSGKTVDVNDFGAKGDGTDDGQRYYDTEFVSLYIYIYKETNSPIHIANSSPHDQLQHPSNINKSKIKINKCIKKNKTMTLMTK